MGKLYAGAAKRCITPSQQLFEEVVAVEAKYSYKEIKEDTFVRAIVAGDGNRRTAIIATDLAVYPLAEKLAQKLSEQFGIAQIDCVISGTREHNAFSVAATEFEEISEPMGRFVRFVHEQTIEAVGEAIEKAVPARVGGAVGKSLINACRDYVTPVGTIEAPSRISGTVADYLPVVRFEDMKGKTIAVFISYAMQSACLSWNQFVGTYDYYCADFVGAVTRYLERQGKDQYPVLWACGGGDDQHAAVSALIEYCDVNEQGEFEFKREILPAEATLILIRQMAAEQGLDVLRTIQTIGEYSDEFNIFSAETYRTVRARKPFRQKLGDRKMPDVLPELEAVQKPLTFRYRLLVLDGIAFLGVNADLYSSYFYKAKDILGCETLAILDACFGKVSSLPDAVNEENNIYGLGTWGGRCYSAREAEDAFTDAVQELARQYKEESN